MGSLLGRSRIVILALALIACDGVSAPGDAWVALDASVDADTFDASDAPAVDGARIDAAASDADIPDAAMLDAAMLDADLPDAASPDADVPDAAVPDADVPDAAMPDAAMPDAAMPDAAVGCPDGDGDGRTSSACGGVDCDDADANRFPGNTEVCDTRDHDEDCNPSTYGDRDRDGDGFADAVCCNVASDGAFVCGDDCDDFALAIRPGAREVCNGIDEDCDVGVDEGTLHTFHRDADRDGFGCLCSDTVAACAAPTGYVEDSSDCDDTLAAYNPGANGTCGECPPYRRLEVCDGLDDDCSGIVDDGTATAGCAVPNGIGICSAGACAFGGCNGGYHACGTTCLSSTSIDSCGTRCTPCTPPAHATATCDGTSCGFRCNTGTVLVSGACNPLPPRPIAPLSTATVTSMRPTLRWALVAGTEGARVEICRDRACSTLVSTFDATGSRGAPSIDLPPGVLFWRLRGLVDGDAGPTTSVTWQFTVGTRTALVDTSYGTTLDVNGDGYPETAVGAASSTWDSVELGSVHVYRGSATGVVTTGATSLVGRDGEGSSFGMAVASAGDVNGDGYSDLIVGSPGPLTSATARAYLYLGGATGLVTTPSRTLVGTGTFSNFGASAASAGDVNGDGYADVVVGAYSVSGGRVYLYLGGASGLSTTAATTLMGSFGLNADFGRGLAGAGDVNGDGYGDVLVGAPGAGTGIGAMLLYLGSASGLVSTPSTTYMGLDASGRLGNSIALAGDVNGDGYSDAIVGARGPSTDPGRAFVFLGSATGLAAAPSTTLVGPDGAGGGFGGAVASARDVNADGYSDVVIGATGVGTGRAYLYLGGAGGISEPALTTLVGPDAMGSAFGFAVAGVGDVDADGFGDVAVSSPWWAVGTGRVRVFLGGSSGLTTPAATTLSGLSGSYYGTELAH